MTTEIADETITITEIKPRRRNNQPKRPNQPASSLSNLKKGIKFVPDTIYGNFRTHSTIEPVRISDLKIDHIYQRNPDRERMSIMAHNWDQDKVGVIVVNHRDDGTYYVIDGQQRVGAISRIVNRPETMLAQVFTGLTGEQEAELFYELDTQRKSLTRGALFQALVAAKDQSAMEIVEAATAAGLTAEYHRGNVLNNLRSFGALMDVHRRVGKDDLAKILRIIAKAWPDAKHSGSGSVILGLEKFFQRYPKASESHLIEALSRTTQRQIDNNARALNSAMSGALGQWTARVILSLYNRGMKTNRLANWD